jgi:putative transposase
VDDAGRRCRFCDALAADQVDFLAQPAAGRTDFRQPCLQGERGIWQRRYWEHTIRDENDFARHVDYIHINPVKHGLVTRVRDWPHSSFHRMVERGIYPEDWAGDVSDDGEAFGERPPEHVAKPE